jgi:3-methyl-2-oxobutanoate hydroxymethyltransferase
MYSSASGGPPGAVRKVTAPDLRARKAAGPAIAMVTAYDFTMARLLDEAGADALLVGDSLGMVFQGLANTLPVTVDEMCYHGRAVARGVARAHVVGDMPFMSYQASPAHAVESAGKLVKEGAFESVKVEGGQDFAEHLRWIVRAGIPVMGHVGLTPQSVHQLGGFKVQRDEGQLLADAAAVEQAGAFAVVVESVPAASAAKLTAAVGIPTIGIGAGAGCDGQVLVFHDMMGLFTDFKPKFVKRYADLGSMIRAAVETYCQEVREGTFPGAEHSFR